MIFWAPKSLGSFTSVLLPTTNTTCLVDLCQLHSQLLLSLVRIPRSRTLDKPCNWGSRIYPATEASTSLEPSPPSLVTLKLYHSVPSLCSFQNPSNQGSPQQLGLQLLLPNPRQWQDYTCLQPNFRGLAVDSETEQQRAHSEITVDPHWARDAWFLAESL